MNITDIKEKVQHIRDIAADDEAAHIAEDDLYESFITFVAESDCDELATMARAVLETSKIRFSRWCA